MTYHIGNLLLPLDPDSPNSLLEDADPLVHGLLTYLTDCLVRDVQDRFTVAATAAGLQETRIVAHPTSTDPVNYGSQEEMTFPALWVERTDWTYQNEATFLNATHLISLHWILPPLQASQAEQIEPIRNAVAGSMFKSLMDPEIGQALDLHSIVVRRGQLRPWENQNTNQIFPVATVFIEVTERLVPTLDGSFASEIESTIAEAQTNPDDPYDLVEMYHDLDPSEDP